MEPEDLDEELVGKLVNDERAIPEYPELESFRRERLGDFLLRTWFRDPESYLPPEVIWR